MGRLAHIGFEVGAFFKGLDGVLEVIGGALLLAIPPERLRAIVIALTQHELSDDPNDFIASHARRAVRAISPEGELFAALYLLSHGVLKVLLVYALLKRKLWAYPVAIVVFAAFGIYQMYRYAVTPSLGMIVLTVLDVFVIALTWLEYRRLGGG